MSISGQNPAGFIQAPKEVPKTVLDSGRQLLRDHRGVCVPSHTPVERHLHACICRDPGNTHAQVRTSDSAAPATQSEPVFMDIRRSATACQACDKSGIIMVGDALTKCQK